MKPASARKVPLLRVNSTSNIEDPRAHSSVLQASTRDRRSIQCPAARPERSSTSPSRHQKNTSAHHAPFQAPRKSSPVQSDKHALANYNDVEPELFTPKCNVRARNNIINHYRQGTLEGSDTMAPWRLRPLSTPRLLSLWNSANCTSA